MTSGIYQITSPSGKRYIGSALNIKQRWKHHRTTLRNGVHHNDHLQKSCNKHGFDALEFKVLLICDKSNLTFYEQRAIDIIRPEFNILRTARSALGFKFSEQQLATLKEAVSTPEYKAKKSASARAQWSDPVQRARLMSSRTNVSEEARKKMSESAKKAWAARRSQGTS